MNMENPNLKKMNIDLWKVLKYFCLKIERNNPLRNFSFE